MTREVEYLDEKMRPYLNWLYVGMANGPESSYGMLLECPVSKDQVVIWIDADPEGNGPGWISPQLLTEEEDDG